MPYLLRQDPTKRICNSPRDLFDTAKAKPFFFPVKFGQPLTPSVLASVPDPYEIVGLKGADLPDIFGADTGPWHVSERVKALIEELEPGQHTFIPINALKDGSKKHVLQQYYVLHTTRVVDAVVYEETDFDRGRGAVLPTHNSGSIARRGQCVLYADKIKGCHLWRGGTTGAGHPRGGIRFGKSTSHPMSL